MGNDSGSSNSNSMGGGYDTSGNNSMDGDNDTSGSGSNQLPSTGNDFVTPALIGGGLSILGIAVLRRKRTGS